MEATHAAREAVQSAGVAMTERAKAVIEQRAQQLREASVVVDDLVQVRLDPPPLTPANPTH